MKAEILEATKDKLRTHKINLSKEIEAVQESMTSDTKSSAGDKYETGREMMNQEVAKLRAQLDIINRNLAVLQNIKANEACDSVRFGALVKTSLADYFISISYGKLALAEQDFMLISALSPLAQLMIGKKEGESVNWKGQEILIEKVK